MSVVAAPADRRFHRAHVKPARRRTWRTLAKPIAKYGAITLIAVYAAYRAAAILADARVLHVERIVVHGNARLATGQVLAVLSGLEGQSLLWADLDEWRQRLLASPWIRDASLRRVLPSTVEVSVSEREPVAIGRIKGGLYLIDERGTLVDEYGPQYADFDLPIVDGLAARSADGRTTTDETRAELAARVIASVKPKPDVLRRVSQIDVSDVHNAAVILNGDSALLYIGEERFLPRLESYLGLLPALRARVPEIDYIDLRFEDRIYVRPTGKVGKSAAKR